MSLTINGKYYSNEEIHRQMEDAMNFTHEDIEKAFALVRNTPYTPLPEEVILDKYNKKQKTLRETMYELNKLLENDKSAKDIYSTRPPRR